MPGRSWRSSRGGALSVPRRSGAVRRARRGSSTRPNRPPTTRTRFVDCCATASATARSPDRSTPGSRCSTRWIPTNAAPPELSPPATRSIGHMAIDVTVLRVFTDPDGNFGNPLGVVDASTVDPATASGSPPNWVTAKRYSSICRSPERTPPTRASSPRHGVTVRRASDGRRVVVAARRSAPRSTRCRCLRASSRSPTRTT